MSNGVLVLCPGDEESRGRIVATVRKCGVRPHSCSSYRQALALFEQRDLAAVFCSDMLEDVDYSVVIETAKPVPVIVVSRFAEWDPYMAALRAGAFDYVACPPDIGEVERILRFALEKHWRLSRHASAVA
jgi:DNA-binding NtrC family response regulator